MSATNRTIKTPNPAERSLAAHADEDNLVNTGGSLPPEGTLYSDIKFKGIFGRDYNQKFSNFVYTGQGQDTEDGATLLFAKNKTEAEANTPFRVTTRFGNHRWPPVLKDLRFIPVQNFPLVTQGFNKNTGAYGNVYAQRYLVREVFIPEATEGSRFVEEEFTSPVPFKIGRYPVPTPTAVSYHFLNLRGSFPECLHKKIDIGDLIADIGTTYGGTFDETYSLLDGQVFPATTFTEWTPYTLSDTQEYTGGVYYRKRVRVYPPPEPKTIVRTS